MLLQSSTSGPCPCFTHALLRNGVPKQVRPSQAVFRLTVSGRARSHARRRQHGHSVHASAQPAADEGIPLRQAEVTLKRPLGIVLAEDADKNTVFVEELVPGGNAEASGKVAVGDVLVRCSATVLKAGKEGQYEKEGYGQRPFDNWDKVMFDCRGQDFKTVMSAIDSNNPRWGIKTVTLVFRRQ